MALNAGELRHRVRIERRQAEVDSNGDVIQDPQTGEVPFVWAILGSRWARIRPHSGREFVESMAYQSEVTARITVRNDLDITASDRVVHEKRGAEVVYNVAAVLPDPDSGLEYVTLMVSCGVNEG